MGSQWHGLVASWLNSSRAGSVHGVCWEGSAAQESSNTFREAALSRNLNETLFVVAFQGCSLSSIFAFADCSYQ